MFNFGRKKKKKDQQSGESANVVSINRQTKHRDNHIFLNASTILARPNCQKSLFQIREVVGVNEEYFQEYYMPVIEAVAVRCQSAPASEYNHHSYEYGLIEHTLEATVYALRSSYQYNYFPDRDEEKIQVLTPIYTYITFVSTMLHDSGKALTDIQFKTLNDGDWKIWSSIYQQIPTEEMCVEYKIERRKDATGNGYHKNTHELIGPLILIESVPSKALKWIAEYSYKYSPLIFTHLIHAVSGDLDNADAIGKNVHAGDTTSAEEYMANNVSAFNKNMDHFGDLKEIPIHEAFVKTLRTLIHDHETYKIIINKRHCSKISHVERYGNMVFFASKFIAELTSKEMTKQGINVPSEKKMYQILSDNGVTFKTPSGDSLWWCDFYINEDANPRDLTYLAIDMEKLANPPLEDLSESNVRLRFSPKTTNSSDHGPMPTETDYDKSVHDIIFANKPQKKEYPTEHKVTQDEPTPVQIAQVDNPSINDVLPEPKEHKELDLGTSLGGLANLGEKPSTKKNNKNNRPNQTKPNNPKNRTNKNKPKVNQNEESTVQPDNLNDLFGELPPEEAAPEAPDNYVPQEALNNTSNKDRSSVEQSTSLEPGNDSSNNVENEDLPHNYFRAPGLPANITNGKGRAGQRQNADKELNNSLLPYIQQQIDSGNLSFNKKDSAIHQTEYGLFIVSPQFFEHFDKTLAKKYRTNIKRSSYCFHDNETSILTFEAETDNEFKKANGINQVHGFLLAFNGLTYNGKKLPINSKLSLKTK